MNQITSLDTPEYNITIKVVWVDFEYARIVGMPHLQETPKRQQFLVAGRKLFRDDQVRKAVIQNRAALPVQRPELEGAGVVEWLGI